MSDASLVESFADGKLLFSEQEQQLSRLEGASAILIPLLERGASIEELAGELANHDVGGDAAEEWVRSLLLQLATQSLLRMEVPAPPSAFGHRQSLQLGACGVELSYSSGELRDCAAPIFGHLETELIQADATFRVAEFCPGLAQIEEVGGSTLLVPREQLAVRLKGMLLERMFNASPTVAALHGALLSRGGGDGVLLLGSPGAGKSTLTLALLSRGYDYASDDVTLVNPDGTLSGVPMAPGVKEGSWGTAEKLGAELTPLPGHMRPDGQLVRFARVSREKLAPSFCSVATIITLNRSDRAVAELRPMSSEEALAELLRESRASDGRCTVETMSALAQLVRDASSFHLHYAEATEAAEMIAGIRDRERG